MPYTPAASIAFDDEIVSTADAFRTNALAVHTLAGFAPANGAFSTTNLALYFPFWVGAPTTVAQLFAEVATASGNIDIGIYDTSFAKLVSSGSTAAAAPMTIIDVADYVLQRGNYYMAFAADNTTISLRRLAVGAAYTRCFGFLMQTSAFPLPATATPVATNQATMPMFGFVTRSTAL